MLSQLFLVACTSLLVSGNIDGKYECPQRISVNSHLKVYGQHCYQFVTDRKKYFDDAQSYCQDNGGTLAMVKSNDVNNFIAGTLRQAYGITSSPVWIGLGYNNGAYRWVDGSALRREYTKFDSTYAESGGSCVAITPLYKTWDVYHCSSDFFSEIFRSNKKRFVCEYPAVLVPTTSPTGNPAPSSTLPHHEKISLDDCPKHVSRDKYLQVYGNKCYMFELNVYKTFNDAEKLCETGGGKLASIESKDLDAFLQENLYHTYGLREHAAWIGLRYNPNYGSHMWIDGTPVTYVNFRFKTFHTSDQCMSISAHDGKWLNKHCMSVSLPYICEFTSSFRPPTTTLAPITTTDVGIFTRIRSKKDDCPVKVSDDKNLQVFEHKCYYFDLKNKVTFQAAETFCKKYGGTLATVNSLEINDFLLGHLVHTHNKTSVYDEYWIGLQYDIDKGGYYWVDGTPMEFRNFHFDQRKECVALNAVTGRWEEAECHPTHYITKQTARLGFICQFESRSPTTTTATTQVTTTPSEAKTTPTTAPTTVAVATTGTTVSTPVPNTTTKPTTIPTPTTPATTPTITTTTTATTTTTTPTTTTMITTITEPTTNTTDPFTTTTTTTPTTTTTTTTPATTPVTTTIQTTREVKAICPSIVCNLDCGLVGYKQSPETKCAVCECDY